MSQLIGTVSLYDCLTEVVVAWTVHDSDEPPESLYRRTSGRDQFPGEGVTSHVEWLRGALTGLLEAL